MKATIINILIFIVALVLGSLVNGFLINISGQIIPPPPGADVTTEEGLKASIHLFEPKHFIFPFLAHALGTLTSAIIVLLFCSNNKIRYAFATAGLFFVGGLMMVFMLPAPMWFNIVDLVFAYFPMAYLAKILFAAKLKETA